MNVCFVVGGSVGRGDLHCVWMSSLQEWMGASYPCVLINRCQIIDTAWKFGVDAYTPNLWHHFCTHPRYTGINTEVVMESPQFSSLISSHQHHEDPVGCCPLPGRLSSGWPWVPHCRWPECQPCWQVAMAGKSFILCNHWLTDWLGFLSHTNAVLTMWDAHVMDVG